MNKRRYPWWSWHLFERTTEHVGREACQHCDGYYGPYADIERAWPPENSKAWVHLQDIQANRENGDYGVEYRFDPFGE